MTNLIKRGSTWYVRIQVRGRDCRRSLKTSSKAEARKRMIKVIEEAEHYRFYGEGRHTWKEAVAEWSKDALESIKRSTRQRYLVSLGQLKAILDELYVDEITASTISRIARRPGVSNATKRRDLTAVAAVLRWCAAHS